MREVAMRSMFVSLALLFVVGGCGGSPKATVREEPKTKPVQDDGQTCAIDDLGKKVSEIARHVAESSASKGTHYPSEELDKCLESVPSNARPTLYRAVFREEKVWNDYRKGAFAWYLLARAGDLGSEIVGELVKAEDPRLREIAVAAYARHAKMLRLTPWRNTAVPNWPIETVPAFVTDSPITKPTLGLHDEECFEPSVGI